MAVSRSRTLSGLLLVIEVAPLFFLLLVRVAESVDGAANSITDEQEEQIVNKHNFIRSRVHPYSSNMRRIFWSEDLAWIAQGSSSECSLRNNRASVGQNLQILTEYDNTTDLADVVQEWYQESIHYDFDKFLCDPFCNCDRFLQVVWARSCEIGCGISFCPDVIGYEGSNIYLLVCNYSPAPPSNFNNRRPYRVGLPCKMCGSNYPECTVNYRMMPNDITSNLCYNTENVCIGSDPHFGIRLPENSLLCYTFQGEHNSTFNIISNSQLEMNALFVPDSRRVNNTWIGSIGITVYHNGRKMTTLQFIASDNTIVIGSRIELNAYTVGKISFTQGKLTVMEIPHKLSFKFPRVDVEFLDSDLKFTVAFVKDQHINLEWHSIGEPFKNSRGVVGQFFRNGVKIDEDKQLLYTPGRSPIPVIQRGLWNFMKHNLADETECWTSVLPSNQGVGLIEGIWTDYRVDSLLAVGH